MSEPGAGYGGGRGRRNDLLDVDLPEDDWLAQGGLDWGDPRHGAPPPPRSRRPRAPLWDEESSEAWRGEDDDYDDRPSDPRWEIVRRRRMAVLGAAALVAVVVIAVAIATAGDGGPKTQTTAPVSTLPTSTTPETTPATTTPAATTPASTTPSATTPAPTDTTPATTPAPTTPDTTTSPTTVTLPAAGKLRFGDSGDAVTALQNALAALDLPVGTPDGRFGAATRDAVIAFQTAQGIAPDGIVGPATVAKLEAAVAAAATDTGAGDSGTTDTDSATTGSTTVTLPATGRLAFGDTGDAVTALQNALAALELDVGTPDGRFGAATRDAVIAFQTAQGLTPDGIVGPGTVAKLEAAIQAAASGQPLPVTIPTSVTLPAAGKLQPGDTGTEVTTLQQALAALDLDVGTPDGTYGPATKAAVAQFQTAQGLTPDGIVGAATVEKLNTALASRG